LIGIDTSRDSIVNEIRAGTIIFLIVNMTKPTAYLVVFLLRRSRLLALVAYLLRALANHTLFLVVALTGNFLALLYAALERVLLALLAGSYLAALLARHASIALLSTPLFIGPPLCFRILCGLVLLVLIGHYGLLWLRETGRHDCRPY
jgi:hypothetical protein